jgi:hypothetical protein
MTLLYFRVAAFSYEFLFVTQVLTFIEAVNAIPKAF